jgi:hypothetical protein
LSTKYKSFEFEISLKAVVSRAFKMQENNSEKDFSVKNKMKRVNKHSTLKHGRKRQRTHSLAKGGVKQQNEYSLVKRLRGVKRQNKHVKRVQNYSVRVNNETIWKKFRNQARKEIKTSVINSYISATTFCNKFTNDTIHKQIMATQDQILKDCKNTLTKIKALKLAIDKHWHLILEHTN